MSKMKCLVIDDEFHAVEVLTAFISQTPYLQLLDSTTDPFRGMELIRSRHPDLVFLDINMDQLTGLDIRELTDKNIQTVFCTASSEHAIRGYELSVTDYLLKPISYKRFLQSVERVYKVFTTRQPKLEKEPYILAKVDHKGKLVKINLPDIDYIEARGNYIIFNHGKQKSMTLGTLREIEKQLPGNHFLRAHRSFLVAATKIHSLEYFYLVLKNSHQKIPVGRAFKAKLIQQLSKQSLLRPPEQQL